MKKVRDLRRPAMKVLVKKTYNFVDLLWAMYITQKIHVRLYTVYVYLRTFFYVRELEDESDYEKDSSDIEDGLPIIQTMTILMIINSEFTCT